MSYLPIVYGRPQLLQLSVGALPLTEKCHSTVALDVKPNLVGHYVRRFIVPHLPPDLTCLLKVHLRSPGTADTVARLALRGLPLT